MFLKAYNMKWLGVRWSDSRCRQRLEISIGPDFLDLMDPDPPLCDFDMLLKLLKMLVFTGRNSDFTALIALRGSSA